MKKYSLIFILSSLVVATYLIFPLTDKSKFVSLKNNSFYVNDTAFYPIVLNYIARIQSDGKNFWVAPTADYELDKKHRFTTKDSTLLHFKSEMKLIKSLGFNTVRIVGIGEVNINEKQEGALSYRVNLNNQKDSTIQLNTEKEYEVYLTILEEMVDIIDEAGLKLIFLTRMSVDYNTTDYYLFQLCNRFKDNPAILAWDLFNEPLYFEESARKKKEIIKIANRWQQTIDIYAKKHLSTIGLQGIREVFKWDANLLPFDFISFHPYQYEPEQVRNEIYWFGKHIEKPWIIGETAEPADNDSIPYTHQKEFAEKTIQQAYHCGSLGYSWWQYKDVDWQQFHADFMGVISQQGKTNIDSFIVNGSIKPVAEVFKNFNPKQIKDSIKCECLDNYYNYSNGDVFKLTGVLTDTNNVPIEGGVILAWNENWTHSYHTITKKDGSFKLKGTYPFYHWMASATKHAMVRGEINPNTAIIGKDSIKTISLNQLKIEPIFINSNH